MYVVVTMNTVKQQRPFLEVLRKARPTVRKAILKHADKSLIHCFRLICYNILRGNIKLKPRDRIRLGKHRNSLRKIAYTKNANIVKRELQQRGGFLGKIIDGIKWLFGL